MPTNQILGIVSIVPMGAWSASTTYQKLNLVRHNGVAYLAFGSSIAVEPGVSTNWENIWMPIVYDGGTKVFDSAITVRDTNSDYETDYTALGSRIWASGNTDYTQWGRDIEFTTNDGSTTHRLSLPHKTGTLATTDDVSAIDGYVDKSLYNLGAFDTYVDNGDGTVTVTRKTGYIKLDGSWNWEAENTISADAVSFLISDLYLYDGKAASLIKNNLLPSYTASASGTIVGQPNSWLSGTYRLNFYPVTITTLDEWKTYINKNPLYVQYEKTTSYTENLPANVPLNNLDQNMTQMVREEVEKGLNLVDATSIVGIELQSSSLNIEIPINLKAGTYTVIVSTDSGEQVANSIGIYLINARGENLQNISYLATSNKHNTFTITSEVAEQTSAIRVYYNGTGLSGQTITGFMLTAGSNHYPYQPYNGAIVHEIQVPIYFSTTNTSPASTVGGDWISLGSFTVGTTTVYAWQRA